MATTVLLSFISFWRAAAIVLGDLGSSAFYVGGIAEQAIGQAAPWFILGVMLFAWAVRAIYIESSVMFVRGGVYRVVKEAMGGTMAKLSVSALLFDYVLTGPISAVSAGLYIAAPARRRPRRTSASALPIPQGPVRGRARHRHHRVLLAAQHARSARVELRRAPHHADHDRDGRDPARVVVHHAPARGGALPPLPTVEHLSFSDDALGWLKDTRFPAITAIALLIGFGHSFLAMSGYESLAQVYREIESPKPLNLRRTALVVFVYSLVFTGVGQLPRRGADPGRRPAAVLRQPDLRHRHEPGRAAAAAARRSRRSSSWSGS